MEVYLLQEKKKKNKYFERMINDVVNEEEKTE
jgi:hypothetical protein